MQLGDATVMMETCSGENIVPVAATQNGCGGGGEEDDKMMNMNINGGGGNRWPRQETLALLKIRSDMDGVFRDSSLKGPLWEEVSRKLAELGYHRSSKKCKEKFENVYKYHKRTKEGRSGKSEGKTYRFFDQLQALEKQLTFSTYSPKPQQNNNTPTSYPPKTQQNNNTLSSPTTKPNDTTQTISHVTTTVPFTNPTTLISPSPQPNNKNVQCNSLPNMNLLFSTTTTSTSSSTASDEDLEEKYRKKRKWKDYFRRLTRQVLAKQEDMQKKFLEAIDKREKEHMAQQDALRIQEMNRINKEHELLIQERSSAAQKNAAVIAFLQKLSGQPPPQPPPAPELSPALASQVQTQQQLVIPNNNIVEIPNMNNGYKSGNNGGSSPSPSRWPKSEVHALIRIRTSLEAKYQENGPKAPLWEDISAEMKRQGYNRNAKRCKEKWENINKYYKKMKESNKQRRDDSKTCPYFHELEAIYKEKNKTMQNPFGSNSLHSMKSSEMMEPLMVQPEQQWKPPIQYEEGHAEKKNIHEEKEDDNGDVDDDDEDGNMDEYEDGDSMEEDEGGVSSRYEVVTHKLPSMNTVE